MRPIGWIPLLILPLVVLLLVCTGLMADSSTDDSEDFLTFISIAGGIGSVIHLGRCLPLAVSTAWNRSSQRLLMLTPAACLAFTLIVLKTSSARQVATDFSYIAVFL